MRQLIPLALSVNTVAVMWLAGSKRTIGWTLGLAGQAGGLELVIDLPERSRGRITHPLPDDDPETLCEIVRRLAPHIPRDGRWHVEGET